MILLKRIHVAVAITLASVSCTLAHPRHEKIASSRTRSPRFDQRQTSRTLTTVNGAAITGFGLIDTRTNTKVANLVNGTVIDLVNFGSTPPSFNINASFTGTEIRSVVFGRNKNPDFHTENYAWYSFCGNKGTSFSPCPNLGLGAHTVTATPYAQRDGRGEAGASYTVSFTIVQSGTTTQAPATQAPATQAPTLAPTRVPSTLQLIDVTASSTSIDVSSKPSKVELQIQAQDADNGIYEVNVQVVDKFNAYYSGVNCYYSDLSFKRPVTCNVTLDFPQFIRQGNYTLQVLLGNFANQYASFSFEDLARRSLPGTIEVLNRNEDRRDPKLLEFNVSTSQVTILDVAYVNITAVALDVKSGLRSGMIRAIHVDGSLSPMVKEAWVDVDVNDLTPRKPVTLSFTLTFEKNNSPPGNYTLLLTLSDQIGNTAFVREGALASRGFPSSIEVVNDGFDGTKPKLLNFTVLGPTTVDVTLTPAFVTMQLLLQDNLSGVTYASVSIVREGVVSNEFPEMFSSLRFDEPIAIGAPTIVTLTLTVPQYIVSGRYFLDVVLFDAANNAVQYASEDMQSIGFPFVLVVQNALVDTTPPQLLDLVIITPAPLNVSSGTTALEMRMAADDDISGIVYATVAILNVGGVYIKESEVNYNFALQPIASGRTEFNVTLLLGHSTKPGIHSISVTLWDAAGNFIEYTDNDLAQLKLPASLAIVNDSYDDEPPVLSNVKVRSSTTVDVSSSPGVLELELFVRDDVSGFKNGSVTLWGYRQYDRTFAAISEVDFAADERVVGTTVAYNVSLPIPQYLKSGLYTIEVTLDDFGGNSVQTSFDEPDGDPLLPSLQIVNSNEDTEPPKLLNLKALSSLELNVSAGPATIAFEVVVQDDVAGIAHWVFGIRFVSNSMMLTEYHQGSFDVPIAGEPVTFTVQFPFARGARKGRYAWDLAVADATSQMLLLHASDNLVPSGLPGMITVV